MHTLEDDLPSDLKRLDNTKSQAQSLLLLQLAQQRAQQNAASQKLKYTVSTSSQTGEHSYMTSKRARSERIAELDRQMNEDHGIFLLPLPLCHF